MAAARALAGVSPIDYEIAPDLTTWADRFDIAFSYEVIYLLPDIDAHAAAICRPAGARGVLRGDRMPYRQSALARFREVIGGSTNAPVQDRSPEDYAPAFAQAGFGVSVRRFGYKGFVPVLKDRRYYAKLVDAVDYPAEHKLMFRLVKGG